MVSNRSRDGPWDTQDQESCFVWAGNRAPLFPSQAHLVTVSMSPNDDGLYPARDQARDVLADDGLSENRPPQDVPDGAIGALPHLLQLEFCRGHKGDASGIGARMPCLPPLTQRHPLEPPPCSDRCSPGAPWWSFCLAWSHLRHIPSTRASSGVMVAHFTATLYFFVARAESMVTWSSVWSRWGSPRSKYFSCRSTLGRISCRKQARSSQDQMPVCPPPSYPQGRLSYPQERQCACTSSFARFMGRDPFQALRAPYSAGMEGNLTLLPSVSHCLAG